jgi:hypothetical protein
MAVEEVTKVCVFVTGLVQSAQQGGSKETKNPAKKPSSPTAAEEDHGQRAHGRPPCGQPVMQVAGRDRFRTISEQSREPREVAMPQSIPAGLKKEHVLRALADSW